MECNKNQALCQMKWHTFKTYKQWQIEMKTKNKRTRIGVINATKPTLNRILE